MGVTFKYWDDCTEPNDLEEMWNNPDVSKEWLDAGEAKDRKVLLSRDPDGQPYLTQTEMKAVATIIVDRHFRTQIDPGILCAIAEIESDRQLLSQRYNKKTKANNLGLLGITPVIEEQMFSQMNNWAYNIDGDPYQLHKPFINVYFGAAYLKYLSGYEGKERNEEFMVRAFRGGTKKANHKSTLLYWERYLSVRQSLPANREPICCDNFDNQSTVTEAAPTIPSPPIEGPVAAVGKSKYWDSRVSAEDMEELWRHPEVLREWSKSGEKRGAVRFSRDKEKRPYLSRTELKSVAEIIISRYFNTRGLSPAVLCALAEISSMRFVNGVGSQTGLMGIDYHTASWLHRDIGCRAYKIRSVDDLLNPFVSMYYGAAYLMWLANYEGRERTHEFIIQAYIGGPQNVNSEETGPLWLKFQNAYSLYRDPRKDGGSCTIL